MNVAGIRAALAGHLDAYAEVLTASSRQWTARFLRQIAGYAAAAFFALILLLIIVFVAILAAWPTPWRWWVVGGILLLFAAGITAGLVAAQRALRENVAAPWEVLAEELARDLRGPDEPHVGDTRAEVETDERTRAG